VSGARSASRVNTRAMPAMTAAATGRFSKK